METKTIPEMELAIAGLEVECPRGHQSYGHKDCCNKTGKVSRFKTLRRECPHVRQGVSSDDPEWKYDDPYYEDGYYGEDGYSSCNCQGRGWVVVSAESDLNTWLVAIPMTVYRAPMQDETEWIAIIPSRRDGPSYGLTPAAALVAAAYEALK